MLDGSISPMDSSADSIADVLAACPWLRQNLPRYDRWETVRLLAGLLTAPECQPNSIRIETLLHMAVATANGTHIPRRDDLVVWFNRHFSVPQISQLEDPLEDVMVSNVVDESGNHRIFEGIWESNAYWLESLLRTLGQVPISVEIAGVLRSAAALLDLSDAVAERLGIERNSMGSGEPKGRIPLPHFSDLAAAADSVVFSVEELRHMGIEASTLDTFILRSGDEAAILESRLECSPLERRPLLEKEGTIMLALPSAVGAAIRRHALEVMESLNSLRRFERMLLENQTSDLTEDVLRRIGGHPWATDEMPPGLWSNPPTRLLLLPFRFDNDRYGLLFVISAPVVADPNNELDPAGMLANWGPIVTYLQRVTAEIARLPGFVDGLMIFSAGGLGGRGMMFPIPELPSGWLDFSISVPNFLTLASVPDIDLPMISRFARQVKRTQNNGTEILSPNGDFNVISVWRDQGYHVLPSDVPLHTTLFVPPINAILGVRHEVRTKRDIHAAWRSNARQWFGVERKGAFASFAKQRTMPLYVSAELIRRGELAAVVEVGSISCWVTCRVRGNSEMEKSAAYQLWDCLAHWLVPSLEQLHTRFGGVTGTGEIRLNIVDLDRWNFSGSIEPEQNVLLPWSQVNPDVAEVNIDQRFFRTFSQPTNKAEREIVKALLESVCVLWGQPIAIEDIADMRDAIIAEGNARYFHLMSVNEASFAATPGPNTARLVRKEIIAEQWENLGFEERELIDHPVTDRAGIRRIVQRSVSRLKGEIAELLRPLSLRAVVEECYTVMDSLHRDDHTWKVSAAALLAMHPNAAGEVYGEAQAQESKRAAAGLAARAILETALFSWADSRISLKKEMI